MVEPNGLLGEIVARKRSDVAARLGGVDIDALRSRARPTALSLSAALARPGARFIMEVKRASPSGGLMRDGLDPAAQALAYRGAADAISVLTDTPYFGGALADLATVRSVYDGPILAKDFVVDPRQIVEARIAGADAVLVMLSVLDDSQAAAMTCEARRLNMDVLVEAHDAAEVRRAVALGAPIVGINNRDLATLAVDLGTTERLAHLVPKDRLLVAESGVRDRADVERLARHADALLVGSALMRAPRPAHAARALAFGRVKICGLREIADVAQSARRGASFAGLVMVAGTPRAVNLAEAERLAQCARREGAGAVGIFRNAPAQEVADAARTLGLEAVQLHGDEDGDYIAMLRRRLPEETEIWAASAVGETVPEPRPGADRILFDTRVNGQSGGTGTAFDWSRVAQRPETSRALLAGGLDGGNARRAAGLGAWALDVGSGVESRPGRKDPIRLAALFDALRAPARGEDRRC